MRRQIRNNGSKIFFFHLLFDFISVFAFNLGCIAYACLAFRFPYFAYTNDLGVFSLLFIIPTLQFFVSIVIMPFFNKFDWNKKNKSSFILKKIVPFVGLNIWFFFTYLIFGISGESNTFLIFILFIWIGFMFLVYWFFLSRLVHFITKNILNLE